MEYINIIDIKPAQYNPRKITEESFTELQGSLKTLGFLLPIIVNNDNMTIVAGHQRTKACKVVGIEMVPVYFVSKVTLQAEIMFNQVHNGIENEPETLGTILDESLKLGFHEEVDAKNFNIPESLATNVKDTCRLLMDYGNPLCAIVCGKTVVFGNNYIRACQLLNMPCNINIIDESKRMMFDYYFKQQYGYFSYDHIERADYVQGLAQMLNKKFNNSRIYQVALPFIMAENNKDLHIFDFGCGKAFSITHMKTVLGFRHSVGLEFFNHNNKGISVEKGQSMIDGLIKHVERYGLFDYVICDSVLNSVNSQKAEDSVIACLLLFCKPGGSIFFCGRSIESANDMCSQKSNTRNDVFTKKFLDKDGLTSYMREGQWYFQKFHTREAVDAICKRFGLDVFTSLNDNRMWQIGAKKVKELPDEQYMAAIDFEFNMRLPNNQRYGRHNDIRKLFGFPQIQ